MFTASSQKLQLSRFTHLSLSIIFLFFLFSEIKAQPLIEWSEELGGSQNDIPEVVYNTIDGDFIIAGLSASSDGSINDNKGGTDLWVTKLDGNGNLIWEKNYGGSEDDFAMDLQPTLDGGYVMVGGSASANIDLTNNKGRTDLWVLKINADGELLWSKSFGGSGVEMGTSIQTISDGYILAGCTGSGGESGVSAGFGGNEFWVLKLDLDGDLVWEKTYGGKRHDAAKSILVSNNDEFLIAGNTWSNDGDVSNNNGHSDAWIIKIDNVGTLLWEKTFGGDTPDRLNSLSKTNDGNYIFAGVKSEMDLVSNGFYGRYDEQYWVLKFSESGQLLWEETYGGNKYDEAYSVEPTLDGGYIIGGSVQSNLDEFSSNLGNLDAWIIKTDGTGTAEWSKLYGGEGNEDLKSITETFDGGYLMLSATNSYYIDTTFVNNGFYDWWIVKLEGNSINVNLGNDLTVCHEETFVLDANIAGCNCTYLWNDGSTDATRNLSITSTTNYSVTVTNADGLEGIDQITVFASQPSVSISTINIPCFGDQDGAITLTPAEQNYSYLWNTGSTNKDLTNLGAGTYTLTITDDNFCEKIEEIILIQNTDIEISSQLEMPSCYDSEDGAINIFPSGGTGNYTYLWNTGAATQNIDSLESGDYIITITDGNGCEEIQLFTIEVPDSISIISTVFDISCFGEVDGMIQAQAIGGNGGYEYSWSNNESTSTIDSLSEGNYSLVVTDVNGCVQTETFNLSQPDPFLVIPTFTEISCYGMSDGAIDLDVEGGNGGYVFNWSSGANSGLSSGDYNVTITDMNNCEVIESYFLLQPDSLVISIVATDPVDGNDGIISATVTGGNSPYDFIWNDGMYDEAEISDLPAGIYDLIITDANGCTENVSVMLEPTSIFKIENLQTFEIFPNPNDGTFFLKLEFEKRKDIEITIFNELGQIIQQYSHSDNYILEKINLESAASGLFFVKIKTEQGVVVKRVVVQN